MDEKPDNKMPKHVAIIMDGNGRWAKKKGLPRTLGHKAGVEALKGIVKHSNEIGIKILTVYAFSTENWARPKEEVDYLIKYLLIEFLRKEIDELHKNNVTIKVLGDIEPLPSITKAEINKAVLLTKNNTGLKFNIALNYGGRSELINAFKKISQKVISGDIKIQSINEELLSQYLYTAGDDDPDLIIRTGGEKRMSNFLIWQSTYSELYFTDTLWPDFIVESLDEAILDYKNRCRRFGSLEDGGKTC